MAAGEEIFNYVQLNVIRNTTIKLFQKQFKKYYQQKHGYDKIKNALYERFPKVVADNLIMSYYPFG